MENLLFIIQSKQQKTSKIFDKIIVSTDNKKIAKISKEFGAESLF